MPYLLFSVSLSVLLSYFWLLRTRFRKGLSSIPGPFLASISDLWKFKAVYDGDMPRRNIELHEKYGPVVRIGPNDVSFASPEALRTIYASRPVFPKSDFYKPTTPRLNGVQMFNLFSIQDVDYHATLKRNISSLYTKIAVLDLEPTIDRTVILFMQKISNLTNDGPRTLDMSLWVHLFAFDNLGDINVSRRFGFLETGKDVRNMIDTADKILGMTGLWGQSPTLQRLENSIKRLWAWKKSKDNPLLVFSQNQVLDRQKNPTKDPDMLNSFLKLREAYPDKVSVQEIISAIYINLMAGHDVLAVTLRAVFYYLEKNSEVLTKLRAEFSELDKRYHHTDVIPYTETSKLTYLDAVIHEALRIHANTGLILERVVPSEGVTIDGYYIPSGTIVGVNAWVIHRDKKIFGDDVEVFRPERWLEPSKEKVAEMKRSIFSFGDGSRMCIGRNIAMIQIAKVVVEFLRRFDVKRAHPDIDWHVEGNWVTKQTGLDMIVTQITT